jgi:DNA polymerase I-like protein with 3'-5' exonuclease and polymerase domains
MPDSLGLSEGRPAKGRKPPPLLDLATAPLPVLVAEARKAGTTFRLSGARISVDRLDLIRPELRDGLRARRDELWQLFGGPAAEQPPLDLLTQLGITPVVPKTEAEALELIAEIETDSDKAMPEDLRDRPGLIGLDIETMALPGMEERSPIKLTLRGLPYSRQAEFKGTAALDPHRSTPRLVQLYGGGRRCLVMDTRILPINLLAPVMARRTMVIHNAAFELNFLTAAGLTIPCFEDTQQAAALLLGVRRRSLEDAASAYLGVELSKTLQTSDWGAEVLSEGQYAYAAIDAIAAFWMWLHMRRELAQKGRTGAYRLQRDVTPVVVRMMQRGILLDRAAHERQVVSWSTALADARQEFATTTQTSPPTKPDEKRAYLKRVLPESDLRTWPLTEKAGLLSLKKEYLEYVANLPAIQSLLTLSAMEKLLTSFGAPLVDKVSEVTGRLHPTYKVAAAKTGRFSSENPNIQQLPGGKKAPEFRSCIVASPGYVFVAGDYSAMELRAAAAISGDPVWNADFAAGVDPHYRQASAMLGIPEAEVTKDQRNHAKPINFGVIYGSGGRGLAASAWNNYGIRMTIEEALAGRDVLFKRYPGQLRWMEKNADRSMRRGFIEIGRLGRVIEAKWERAETSKRTAKRNGQPADDDYDDEQDAAELAEMWFTMHGGRNSHDSALRYTLCCNAPVQGACADAGMLALLRIDAALREAAIDGALAMFIHDEIVLEVAERQAEQARAILTECMVAAFAETFPDAPLTGLVATGVGATWSAAKPS